MSQACSYLNINQMKNNQKLNMLSVFTKNPYKKLTKKINLIKTSKISILQFLEQ